MKKVVSVIAVLAFVTVAFCQTKQTKADSAKTTKQTAKKSSTKDQGKKDVKYVYKCDMCGYISNKPGTCPKDKCVLVKRTVDSSSI